MKKIKIGLLVKVIIAIILGIATSYILPMPVVKVFVTFNSIFGNFLGFVIPLIILGLVAPGIADLGKSAGKLLLITALIAYGSTVLAGTFSFFTTRWSLPILIERSGDFLSIEQLSKDAISHYFTIDMPPVMSVTSALIFAFVIGLGVSNTQSNSIKKLLSEFRDLVTAIIVKAIIPLLPLYIFGIFLKIASEGQAIMIMSLFFKVIIVIFIMHVLLLLVQFGIAGLIAKKNPIKSLLNMLPAYMTALGTQSSAATIPVTLEQAKKNGVDPELADFVIPLCATIHLSGSMLKIVSCAFAIMWMMEMPYTIEMFIGFIFMLAITMVAAPGVPGGAIMAAIGVLQSMLLFNEQAVGLMIALYIAMDSFGTACNVTGDGAIAMIVNKINIKLNVRTC
ncbi:MAG: dicarboxylate/amino acid:cation symporter [Bacteroidales bacterium]|jgi:Na+/H+-dicarboxylate symporter|nr:dicarboxylate/amino acid:cation symporter [Bacteroidales bacterium]MDD3272855.1 dicarboxylate/amino acid:cation symporter [Bacteroidales bacterium]MDD4058457.1 dicarboxylate/amino acid:cation symporter [Bacteroidales bacterium]